MRRSVRLNANDRKQLLVCCVVGIAGGVMLVAAGLALRHLLGHATPDWDLVVGLSFSLGILLGLLLFLWRQLWQPLNELLTALPLLVRHRVRLDLGHGIAPLLLLSHRINLLLETLNLKSINQSLWTIEDAIRDKERQGQFDAEFVELARQVYLQNDRRAALKRQLNQAYGSELCEEKAYASYAS
jgi:hypothetical protein